MKQKEILLPQADKNNAVIAMEELQKQMLGEAERTGMTSDEAVMELVKDFRTK